MRILIIDDYEPILACLGDALDLEEKGYTIRLARDGQEGLDIWREFGTDLIICDQDMPRMNGWEVFTKTLDSPCRKVMISGNELTPAQAETLSMMGVGFVLKGMDLVEEIIKIAASIE